jgi:hypothetical protein
LATFTIAWDFFKAFVYTIFLIAAMALCASLLIDVAHADVNLTAQCPAGTSSGSKLCTGGVVYRYPVTSAYTRTTGDVFYFWGVIGATGQVSVCPADIPVDSILCPEPTLIVKTAVPLVPPLAPTPSSFRVLVSWTPPTTGIQEGKAVTLKSGDIIGYQIAWVPEAGGRGGEIVTGATETSRIIDLPYEAVRISISAQGIDVWGSSTMPIPIAPSPTGAVIPDSPTNVQASVVP